MQQVHRQHKDSSAWVLLMTNPTPEEIKQTRKEAGLTQAQAADVLGRTLRTWQYWESGKFNMDRNLYELFIIKTSKH